MTLQYADDISYYTLTWLFTLSGLQGNCNTNKNSHMLDLVIVNEVKKLEFTNSYVLVCHVYK